MAEPMGEQAARREVASGRSPGIDGALHCSRGHIVALDRRQLEAQACECYAVGKAEYDRLLADYRHIEADASDRPVRGAHPFLRPATAIA